MSSLITSSFLMVEAKRWSMTVNEQTGASLMKCNLNVFSYIHHNKKMILKISKTGIEPVTLGELTSLD